MSASIEKVKQLYNQGEYLEALEMCKELLEHEELRKDIWLITAKSLMINVPTINSKDAINEAADSLTCAVAETHSVAEAFEVILDFKSAFSIWEKKMHEVALATFEADPSEVNFKNYNGLFLSIFTVSTSATLPAKNSPAMAALLEAENITIKEAVAKYENKQPYEKAFTDVVRYQMEFETASKVVARVQQVFKQNQTLSSANFQAKNVAIGGPLIYATSIYDPLKKDHEDIPNDVKFQRLEAFASWKRFLYEAVYTVDGKPVYMYTMSEQDLNELKEVYAKMQAINPAFVIPPMPVQKTQTKSGCYVATAVYGSYDCPQVWTLRRYRDDTLAQTWYGRAFIKAYYAVSPTLVKWFGQTQWFKKMWQSKLDHMVSKLQERGVESTPYEDKNW